jgi:hypothetical protein
MASARMVTKLNVPRAKAHVGALGTTGPADRGNVTLINFGPKAWPQPAVERAVPREREQSSCIAGTQPVGAFAAHPDECRGAGDAAGARQRGKEAELALDGPTVAADAVRGSRLGLAHRPASITKGVL